MTIKECYEKVGSDYDGVLKRLGSEALVKRFAVKFLNDPSFQELTDGLAAQDGEKAFRAAHTLKGVCRTLDLQNCIRSVQSLRRYEEEEKPQEVMSFTRR